jgi:hypothetical protein
VTGGAIRYVERILCLTWKLEGLVCLRELEVRTFLGFFFFYKISLKNLLGGGEIFIF